MSGQRDRAIYLWPEVIEMMWFRNLRRVAALDMRFLPIFRKKKVWEVGWLAKWKRKRITENAEEKREHRPRFVREIGWSFGVPAAWQIVRLRGRKGRPPPLTMILGGVGVAGSSLERAR